MEGGIGIGYEISFPTQFLGGTKKRRTGCFSESVAPVRSAQSKYFCGRRKGQTVFSIEHKVLHSGVCKTTLLYNSEQC
jgi:hypothetical protein